jgi:hypothetical protein
MCANIKDAAINIIANDNLFLGIMQVAIYHPNNVVTDPKSTLAQPSQKQMGAQ